MSRAAFVYSLFFFFFQAEDGIRDIGVTGVQTCALPIYYFLAYYREHKLDNTRMYDGVREALASIRQSRNGQLRKMAVLSNKPVNPSRAIIEGLGLAEFFAQVYGGNSFPTKKPDPLGAQKLLEEMACLPRETVMVGDSSNDVLTGRNAGLCTVGVTYGFAPQSLELTPPDVLVDSPWELAQIFR